MARTVTEIAASIRSGIEEKMQLSTSAAAEWRLWTYIVATAINAFELILDAFKSEIDETVYASRPGTQRWYIEMCYRFQNGHELVYNPATATVDYAISDPAARITAVAAVKDSTDGTIVIKVAKLQGEELTPFSPVELLNFSNYINVIKFAGARTSVISTEGDKVLYDVDVFFSPTHPVDAIRERCEAAMDAFRDAQQFDGILFPEQFTKALLQVDGVITISLNAFKRKGSSDLDFSPVIVSDELEAGYFNYDGDSVLSCKPVSELPL